MRPPTELGVQFILSVFAKDKESLDIHTWGRGEHNKAVESDSSDKALTRRPGYISDCLAAERNNVLTINQ